VNPIRRGVADENIQARPYLHTVEQQAGQHLEGSQVASALGVLIDAIGAVTDAAAKAADQNIFVADSFQVQAGAAFGLERVLD
jgi:hypothetical protein